jgi:hypothetical protein
MTRILLLFPVLLAACGEEVPFEISHNQAPSASCGLSDRDTGDEIRAGTFDISIGDRSSYVLTPLVHNRTSSSIEITSARIFVYEETAAGPIQVRILCEGGDICDQWDIDPCTGGACPTVPAEGTASFELSILPRLVTGYYQSRLDQAVVEGRVPPEFRLTSTIELIGTTGGAAEITSAPFSYTMRFCLGCLVEFPPASDSPAITGQDCCALGGPTPSCYPGQDAPIDCRLCTMTSPVICNFGRTSC